jgi:hypothetical protein
VAAFTGQGVVRGLLGFVAAGVFFYCFFWVHFFFFFPFSFSFFLFLFF